MVMAAGWLAERSWQYVQLETAQRKLDAARMAGGTAAKDAERQANVEIEQIKKKLRGGWARE